MKIRLILLAAAVLMAFLAIIHFRIKWIKKTPGVSNKAFLEAFASRIVLEFVLVFLLAWSNARYGIPEEILKARWLTTAAMAAIIVSYLIVWWILRLKFLQRENAQGKDITPAKSD